MKTKIIVLLGFLLVSLLFYSRVFWSELIFDRSTVGAVHGEIQATEWVMENIYQTIIKGGNPFQPIKSILYPFGLDMVGSDVGFAFNYILFRPFLSPHQSLAMIMMFSLLLANIGMYVLLRKLNFNRLISFIFGLAYGNATFLIVRHGHPGYFVIYLFPWFYYFWLVLATTKNRPSKIFMSLLIPFTGIMTLWQNMYYFIVLFIGFLAYCFYLLIYKRKESIFFIKKNFQYLGLMALVLTLFLIPWFNELYKTLLFSESPTGTGWNGAIEFSPDIFGIFLPSGYNYYYGKLVSILSSQIPFMQRIFENYIYPGIIILGAYFLYIVFYQKISQKVKEKIKPFFLISILFYILSLGPFLHITGQWFVQLDEGIRLVFPLPFVLLHYIPFIGNIRAPGRFIIGFIFFAYIVCAYLFDNFFKSKKKVFIIAVILIIVIIIIDHRPVNNSSALSIFYPKKIYSYIKKDKENFSVLEIPFVVRDGFTYLGGFNSIGMTVGQSYYKKPFIGGYSGRIPDYVKEYYQNNPMIGYLGRLLDKGIKNNPIINQDDLINWQEPDLAKSLDTIDFLDIKYIIVNRNYANNKIIGYLDNLGYKKINSEEKFSLYSRQPSKKDFLNIDVPATGSALLLGMGWNPREEGYRWANRRSSVMFKIANPKNMTLHFTSNTFNAEQPVSIYINQKKAGSIITTPGMKDYQIEIKKEMILSGINTIHFVYKQAFRPSDIISGNIDGRKLSSKYKKIWLTSK